MLILLLLKLAVVKRKYTTTYLYVFMRSHYLEGSCTILLYALPEKHLKTKHTPAAYRRCILDKRSKDDEKAVKIHRNLAV